MNIYKIDRIKHTTQSCALEVAEVKVAGGCTTSPVVSLSGFLLVQLCRTVPLHSPKLHPRLTETLSWTCQLLTCSHWQLTKAIPDQRSSIMVEGSHICKPMQNPVKVKKWLGWWGNSNHKHKSSSNPISGYPSNVSHLSPDLMVEGSHNAMDTDQDSMLDSSPSGRTHHTLCTTGEVVQPPSTLTTATFNAQLCLSCNCV